MKGGEGMRKILCVVGVLAITSSAMAYTFTEDFEGGLTAWSPPSGYGALPISTGTNHTPGGNKSLLANNNYGATKRGEQHLFGETLVPSDANPTTLDYWMMAPGTSRKRTDIIVAISMGEAGTDWTLPAWGDAPLATAIPVVAYCMPYTDNVRAGIFDGKKWYNSTAGLQVGSTWYNFHLEARASTLYLDHTSDGPYTVPIEYTGGYDRVSVLYEGNSPAGAYVGYVDDLSVTGVPEPATLSFLALGGLALLRRRRF